MDLPSIADRYAASPSGLLTVNEIRAIENLPPLPSSGPASDPTEGE